MARLKLPECNYESPHKSPSAVRACNYYHAVVISIIPFSASEIHFNMISSLHKCYGQFLLFRFSHRNSIHILVFLYLFYIPIHLVFHCKHSKRKCKQCKLQILSQCNFLHCAVSAFLLMENISIPILPEKKISGMLLWFDNFQERNTWPKRNPIINVIFFTNFGTFFLLKH